MHSTYLFSHMTRLDFLLKNKTKQNKTCHFVLLCSGSKALENIWLYSILNVFHSIKINWYSVLYNLVCFFSFNVYFRLNLWFVLLQCYYFWKYKIVCFTLCLKSVIKIHFSPLETGCLFFSFSLAFLVTSFTQIIFDKAHYSCKIIPCASRKQQ